MRAKELFNGMGIIIAVILIFVVMCRGQVSTWQYEFIDLGYLEDGYSANSYASAINNSGQIVGSSRLITSGYYHGFLWDKGIMTDIGTLEGGQNSFAYDINDSGVIVGYSNHGTMFDDRAFLWQDGIMEEVPVIGGHGHSTVFGVTDSGDIYGQARPDHVANYIFKWDGSITNLGNLGIDELRGWNCSINNQGDMVGRYKDDSNPNANYEYAFLGQDGVMTNLGTLGGHESMGLAVNDNDVVVGYSEISGGGGRYAIVWEKGTMTELPGLGLGSEAIAVNNSGVIVGRAYDITDPIFDPLTGLIIGYNSHAVAWTSGEIIDLNNIVDLSGTNWQRLALASGINERGQIVGSGNYKQPLNNGYVSTARAFLLNPLDMNKLTLLKPSSTEVLEAGTTYTIKWVDSRYDACGGDYTLSYSANNGNEWVTIDSNVSDTCFYDWEVPFVDSNLSLIRISDNDAPEDMDLSSLFTLHKCHGEIVADLDEDCYVNIVDFAIFASYWLECDNVLDPVCN